MIDLRTIELLELLGALPAPQRIALCESARLEFGEYALRPSEAARQREVGIMEALDSIPLDVEARWGLIGIFKVIRALSPAAQFEVHAVLSVMSKPSGPMPPMAEA